MQQNLAQSIFSVILDLFACCWFCSHFALAISFAFLFSQNTRPLLLHQDINGLCPALQIAFHILLWHIKWIMQDIGKSTRKLKA
jgi:hypothetical protein